MKPRHQSLWQATGVPHFSPATSGSFDVVVIGGGIAGVTAAYLLKRAGKRVCLLERERIGAVDTGHTTAHLTYVTDERLTQLVKHFGRDGARLAWEGGAAAIHTIEEIVGQEQIDCAFRRVPGFLHAPLDASQDESREFKKEAKLAAELGFVATYNPSVPIYGTPGIRFADQGKFHPLAYISALAERIQGDGCAVFDRSEVSEVEDEPLAVKVNGQRIQCGYLVIATHTPLMGKRGMISSTLFQSKLALYSSYVVGAKTPKGALPEADFWDTSDPYYYLRIERGDQHDYVIFGGEDHKTGQEQDTDACFTRLEAALHQVIPSAKVDRRWSGQVVETHDGLPYIGEVAEQQFVSTGFAGNGMTFGTLSGMMACDAVLGRENAWSDLLSPKRTKVRGAAWEYLKQNADYPYYLVADRLRGAEAKSTRDVKRGEGKVLKLDGEHVACYRDEDGKLSQVSAVCTHMGCLVRFNPAEQTWDCPCHGSRFRTDGEVFAGPAESPLEPVSDQNRKPARRRSAAAGASRR